MLKCIVRSVGLGRSEYHSLWGHTVLGATAKLRGGWGTISFVTPVLPCLFPYRTSWAPNGRIFAKCDILGFFSKIRRENSGFR